MKELLERTSFEEVSCELCGAEETRPIFEVKDYERGFPGAFQIVQCRKCQLTFLNPRPTKEAIGAYYTRDDWYRAKEGVSLEEAQISNRPWREIQAFRCRPVLTYKESGTILDVGCGDGLLLKFFSEKGWHCYGIERGEIAASYARGLGLEVRQESIEEISFQENFFDVVSFFAVIEHLHHPLSALRKVSRFLKEDGFLYLGGIPNFECFERKLFGRRWMHLNAPRHLFHFTPQTMKPLLEEAGYREVDSGFYSQEGRVVMGYTESLRHVLSDWGMYPPKKPEGPTASSGEERRKRPDFLLNTLHGIETTFFIGLGKVSNRIGKGSQFWVIAKKV